MMIIFREMSEQLYICIFVFNLKNTSDIFDVFFIKFVVKTFRKCLIHPRNHSIRKTMWT